jgi:hypothetical protein
MTTDKRCIVLYNYRYWTDKPFALQCEFFENAVAIEKWINEKFQGKDIDQFPNSANFEIIFIGAIGSEYKPVLKEKVKQIVIEV